MMNFNIRKFIIILFILFTAISFTYTYYTMVVKKNYYIFAFIPCLSENKSGCFVDPELEDPYLKIYKKAFLFRECTPEDENEFGLNCNLKCDVQDENCYILSCNDDTKESYEECYE